MRISDEEFVSCVEVVANFIGARPRGRGFVPPDRAAWDETLHKLGSETCAFLVATYAATKEVPILHPNETAYAFRQRVGTDCLVNLPLWKRGILAKGAFRVPERIAAALAQDLNWLPGIGNIVDAAVVPGEQHVHVEALCRKRPDADPKWLVVYPRAIDRGGETIEIVSGGHLHKLTVKFSSWQVNLGWVERYAGPRNLRRTNTDNSGKSGGGDQTHDHAPLPTPRLR